MFGVFRAVGLQSTKFAWLLSCWQSYSVIISSYVRLRDRCLQTPWEPYLDAA